MWAERRSGASKFVKSVSGGPWGPMAAVLREVVIQSTAPPASSAAFPPTHSIEAKSARVRQAGAEPLLCGPPAVWLERAT